MKFTGGSNRKECWKSIKVCRNYKRMSRDSQSKTNCELTCYMLNNQIHFASYELHNSILISTTRELAKNVKLFIFSFSSSYQSVLSSVLLLTW